MGGADPGITFRVTGGNPKLYLDMDLDDRQGAGVIGGGTTIVVKEAMLHEGERKARYGV